MSMLPEYGDKEVTEASDQYGHHEEEDHDEGMSSDYHIVGLIAIGE